MKDANMSAAELDEYAAAIQDFCRQRLPEPITARPGVVRDPQVARDHWKSLAVDLGAGALLVPEEYGGEGAGVIEAGRVAEALGARLAPLPYLPSAVLTPSLLTASEGEGAADVLGRIVNGAIAAVAWAADDPGAAGGSLELSGGRATGRFGYVLDADVAEVILLVAPDASRIVAVEAADAQITARPSFDLTRAFCDVEVTDAAAIDLGDGRAGFAALLDAGRLAVAAESAGGAQAALDLAVAYAKQRVQFGREIGSFQAVKHLLADAFVAAESAVSVARLAAQAQVRQAPDAAQLLALAAFYPADRFAAVATTGIQVHGGIGFTVECAAHLYRRRAESNRHILGIPDKLRAAYVETLRADEGAAA